jgi:hypothetical protein
MICGLPAADQQRCFPASAYRWIPFRCSSHPDAKKAHDVARIRSVLDQHTSRLGTTLAPFLGALLSYWGAVSDLVQRQEHGAQKEGTPLMWADGRRVVFQTAIVMFETDRALS